MNPILHPEEPVIFDIAKREFDEFFDKWQTPQFVIRDVYLPAKNPYRMAGCRELASFHLIRLNDPRHSFYEKDPILPVVLSKQYYGNKSFSDISLNIVRFIDFVEDKINLDKRTKVHKTKYERLIQIHPAPLWFSSHVFAGLFTLIVRVGGFFTEDSTLDEMLHRDYFLNTQGAFKKFLNGNIYFYDRYRYYRGWDNAFRYDYNLNLLRKRSFFDKLKEYFNLKKPVKAY